MKALLIITAVLESGTGLALMAIPSALSSLLLGVALVEPAGLVVARLAGAALLTIGIACWQGRHSAPRGLILALLTYNVAACATLAQAALARGLSGLGLWPAIILHFILGLCCLACLRRANRSGTRPRS